MAMTAAQVQQASALLVKRKAIKDAMVANRGFRIQSLSPLGSVTAINEVRQSSIAAMLNKEIEWIEDSLAALGVEVQSGE